MYKYHTTHSDHARPRRAKRTYKVSCDEEWSLFHILYILWTLVGDRLSSRYFVDTSWDRRGGGQIDTPFRRTVWTNTTHVRVYYTPILILS